MIQKFVDNAQQCFAFLPQANFPAHNLIFTEGEGDGIKSRLPFKAFSILYKGLDFIFEQQILARIT